MRPDTRDWKLIGVTIAVVLGVFAIVFTETQIKNADASPVLTWTKESPASSAPASAGTSMAYDQATGSLVLFGGDGSGTGTALDGTWLWTGSTWAEQSPATSPPARSNAAMAYDAATGDVVLFGGIGSSGNYLSDTWTWNGSNWTEQSPRTSPSPRADAAVANDQASGDIVLFGGEATNGQSLGDTWTWNGSNWAQAEPSRSPAARTNSSMAYDPATGVVVLFSGFSFSPLCCSADTWTWNGSNWAEQSPSTSPPAVTAATMIYDPSASEIVLFGGFAGGSVSSYNETWTWNGSTWSNQSPGTSPPGRMDASMAYDGSNGSVVLFAGSGGAGLLDDTWVLTSSGTVSSTGPTSTTTRTTPSTSPITTTTTPSVTTTTQATRTTTSTTPTTTSSAPTSTRTTLVSPTNPSSVGQRVTYSATVSPAPNGGTVRFTDDGSTVSGCSAVSVSPGSGTASCSATSSGAGSHEIEAIYSGSAGFGASSSNELTQVVQTTQVTQSGTSGLGFTPLSPPMRIADTRPGATDPTTYAGRTLGPGQSITIDMPASVPSNAGAVVAQLTAIGATRAGYLAAYATGGSRPETANVNFAAGQIVGNLVTVGLGVDTNGALALSIYNGPSGTTDFTLDLYGYYATDTSTAGDGYVPLTPTRIFDTRATSGLAGEGMTLGSGGTATVPVSGVGGVPQNTVGVVVNVAVVDTTAPSYVQGYPTGSPPASSTPTVVENWGPGELLSAKAIIGVGQKGSITFANAAGSTDLVVDVDGYFLPPGSGGALFNPLPTPVRLADTRPDGIPGGTSLPVLVAGANDVPTSASAGVLNLVDIATGPDYLTVYPSGQAVPTAADVNYAIGDLDQIVGNSSYADVGVGGGVEIYNGPADAARVNVVVDEFGYFTAG